MKKFLLPALIIFLISTISFAQNVGQKGDTLINYKDINGMKQGKWTKKYKSGKTAYIATFKNDKLIGLYQRFHTTGKLGLEVNYDENESGYAKIYYDDGKLGAEGNYINRNVKDGLWKFYGVDGKLIIEINYKNGILNGKESKYWRNGNLMEEKNWKDGKQEGLWAQYFENGRDRLKTRMINDKRNGVFYVYYPNGRYYAKGAYKDNLRVGHWTFYDKDGTVTRDTEYTNGVAADQDEIDAKTTKEIEEWEQMKGVIPDPNIDNMFKYDKTYGPLSK